MITLETYSKIKRYSKPVMMVAVVLFFLKEISFLINTLTIFRWIPDIVFLLIFLEYLVVDFLPYYKPEWIDGYEAEEVKFEEVDEQEEADESRSEIDKLEDIAL